MTPLEQHNLNQQRNRERKLVEASLEAVEKALTGEPWIVEHWNRQVVMQATPEAIQTAKRMRTRERLIARLARL